MLPLDCLRCILRNIRPQYNLRLVNKSFRDAFRNCHRNSAPALLHIDVLAAMYLIIGRKQGTVSHRKCNLRKVFITAMKLGLTGIIRLLLKLWPDFRVRSDVVYDLIGELDISNSNSDVSFRYQRLGSCCVILEQHGWNLFDKKLSPCDVARMNQPYFLPYSINTVDRYNVSAIQISADLINETITEFFMRLVNLKKIPSYIWLGISKMPNLLVKYREFINHNVANSLFDSCQLQFIIDLTQEYKENDRRYNLVIQQIKDILQHKYPDFVILITTNSDNCWLDWDAPIEYQYDHKHQNIFIRCIKNRNLSLIEQITGKIDMNHYNANSITTKIWYWGVI